MDLVNLVEKLINTFIGENTNVSNDDFELMIDELISLKTDIQEAYTVIQRQDKTIEAQQLEIEQLKDSREVNRLSEIPTNQLNCMHQKDYWEEECSKCDGLKDCRIEECDHIGTD